MSNFAT
jgi:hypothetical protein